MRGPGAGRGPLLLSLRPVAERLSELLEAPVAFSRECVGPAAVAARDGLDNGGVCLLENLRFHGGEKQNDERFTDALAQLAEVYVDDAFGTAHRAHASVVGVPRRISRRAAGHLLVREVETLTALLEKPSRPFAAVIGGAKIEGKADTLKNLLPRLDLLVLGGAMANTFLAAQGLSLGRSLVEEGRIALAGEILGRAKELGVAVLLPSDVVVADDLDEPAHIETVAVERIPANLMAVDIGVRTRDEVTAALAAAQTIFWNGPMGVFENAAFAAGTLATAAAVAACEGLTVIGGGETVAAAKLAGVTDRIRHVSTGGGAALELLAGRQLPGVAILEVSQ